MKNTFKIPPTKLGVYLWVRQISVEDFKYNTPYSSSYLSQLIWGKRKDKKAFQIIADALKVDLDEIWEN